MSGYQSNQHAAALAAIDAAMGQPNNAAVRMVAHYQLIAELFEERPSANGAAIAAGLSTKLCQSFSHAEVRAIASYVRALKVGKKRTKNTKRKVSTRVKRTPANAASRAPTAKLAPAGAASSPTPPAPAIAEVDLVARIAAGIHGMVFKGHGRPVQSFFDAIQRKLPVVSVIKLAGDISRDEKAMADVGTLAEYDATTVLMFIAAGQASV